MNIQNLVRERVVGNIKTGLKGENGVPKKLSYFHVEEDKGTTTDMVDIFKQMYPNKPNKLIIRFVSEDPFSFKFKRYINGKAVCIGNDIKAITIGKDENERNTQVEVECNEECEHRQSGKCKLKGSLKFVLDGIEAGGVWNLSTSGGISLSNIASEIVKYKKANMSIVDVPFELSLTEQESLAYGKYYSIDLRRIDIKPQLTSQNTNTLLEKQETKQLTSGKKVNEKNNKPKSNGEKKNEFSNYLTFNKSMPTLIKEKKFDKLIFQDVNMQDVEYILHPKANQEILKYGVGTVIEVISSTIEMEKNILCKYEVKKIVNENGEIVEINNEIKEAV